MSHASEQQIAEARAALDAIGRMLATKDATIRNAAALRTPGGKRAITTTEIAERIGQSRNTVAKIAGHIPDRRGSRNG